MIDEDKALVRLKLAVKRLLKTSDGRAFIWYVLSLCELYSSTFTGNSTTFYREGKRDIGLEILRLLEEVDPTAYPRLILLMQKEEMTDA